MGAIKDHEDSSTGAVPEISATSVCTALDKLEKSPQAVQGANIIVGDTEALSTILSPIKMWLSKSPSSPRELNIDGANLSLRIVKNLIDAGSCWPSAATDGSVFFLSLQVSLLEPRFQTVMVLQ